MGEMRLTPADPKAEEISPPVIGPFYTYFAVFKRPPPFWKLL